MRKQLISFDQVIKFL